MDFLDGSFAGSVGIALRRQGENMRVFVAASRKGGSGKTVTSRHLARKRVNGCPLLHLPHGVDVDHFAGSAERDKVVPALEHLPRPIVGFFGLLGPWFDRELLIHLSEVFSAGQFLFMNDGYGVDWLKTVETAAGLGAEIFVPGHSSMPAEPRQSREEFSRYRQMLVDVRDSVAQAIARGVTEDQAVATIQWPQYEKIRGYDSQRQTVIRRLYRQLTGVLP